VAAPAAFFDMDKTVLEVDSGMLWMRFLRRRGEISRLALARAAGWALSYKLALLDMATLSRRLIADLAGDDEQEMIDKCLVFFEAHVASRVAPKAREAIEDHRSRGEQVVLLTASTPYVAKPLAEALKLDGVICSRLEVSQGKFTGKIVEPLCFGHGKISWAERFAGERAIDLGASTFYTDSYNDLPMLERVGRPVAVNPDPRLARHARRRGWPIHMWSND
jgi:HAD superfamily hydrolase (TIGR01490 family)